MDFYLFLEAGRENDMERPDPVQDVEKSGSQKGSGHLRAVDESADECGRETM